MILTGEPDDETELDSLEIDVDLYISKRKKMEVIVKYIKVLLEKRKFRTPINEEVTSREEGICITLNTHLVTKNSVEVSLTPRQYQILKVFLENKGVTLSRQEIINVVWGNPV